MKILFFIENLRSGGKERRLVELIKGLRKNPDIKTELVITRPDVHYKDVWKLGIDIHVIERKTKKDPLLFFKFFRIAQRFRPDIIHVWGNMVAVYAIPAKLILNIPMINSQITDVPVAIKRGLLSSRITFLFSDLILANSQAGLKAYDAPAEKSGVIYNGFNFDRVRDIDSRQKIRDHFGLKAKYIVAMVGGFKPLKDNKTFLLGANCVLAEEKDVLFLCIGRGDPEPFKKYVHPQYLNNILFMGEINNVEKVMSICDVGVLTSYNEGIPNTIMEFMALSVPVVVTDGGGIRELVEDEKSGYIIPQQDPAALSEKILHLLSNKKKRLEMGRQGRKKIEEDFKLDIMIDNHYKIYRSLSSDSRKTD